MLFNSAVFLILFLVFYLLYWPLSVKGKHILIIITSLIFYGWYSLTFLLLFLFILTLSYLLSIPILKKKSKLALILGLILIIGNLFFFKYFYLFAQSIGFLFGNDYLLHIKTNWQDDYKYTIVLPIAISFYTFQIIAYLVDCYRGTISELIVFRKYVVFILYFPQFIAGPIMRSTDFISQIDNPIPSRDRMLNGSLLILQGIFKKVLIADLIGAEIGPVFMNPDKYDASMLLLLIPGFISQIYADFSGYTDMARGMSKLLGYDIPENFKGPFLSSSMTEFWRRWHITLSTWLRDYIFFPLGGSKRGNLITYLNLLVTMGIGGIWHGANWNMLFWGIFVGSIIVVERFLDRQGLQLMPKNKYTHIIRVAFTYLMFGISGLFFVAPDIQHTWDIMSGILHWQGGALMPRAGGVVLLSILVYFFNVIQYDEKAALWLNPRTKLKYVLVVFGTFLIGMLVNMYGDSSGSFIYFSF